MPEINDKKAIIIQSLPVEGKNGLEEGGYTYTMTARELIDILKEKYEIPPSESIKVTGVGATEFLGSELTFMGEKLYVISGENKEITTKELDVNTKVSFSQIGLTPTHENPSGQTKHFKHISAENSDKNVHEINHGGAFKKLLEEIGGEQSAVLTVSAELKYIKTRAVCPNVNFTTKLTKMILGDPELKISPQTVKEQKFSDWQRIEFSGIITGKNMLENKILKGLHLHCEHGHVLDLGELRNVIVKSTSASKIFILLPEENKNGKRHWHIALLKEDEGNVIKCQSYIRRSLAISLFKKEKVDPKIPLTQTPNLIL